MRLKPGQGAGGEETEELQEVKQLSAGYNHVLVLLKNGEVLGWGDDSKGELGEEEKSLPPNICQKGPETPCFEVARPIVGLPSGKVEAVAAGTKYSLVLINHTVYAFGWDGYGQLGDGISWREQKELCLTTHDYEKYAAKIKKAEETGKTSEVNMFKTNEQQAGACSREPVPVKECGGATLEHVSAIKAGGDHAIALLEPGLRGPQLQYSAMTLSAKEGEAGPSVHLTWEETSWIVSPITQTKI
jgi:Regulator of chromosome condensation (RCC1) repeat